jgi:hypothetical protein
MFGRSSDDRDHRHIAEALDLAFDGAADVVQAWRDGLRSDPDLIDSAYVHKHRILSPRGSNEAGACRAARPPRDHNTLSPQHSAQR